MVSQVYVSQIIRSMEATNMKADKSPLKYVIYWICTTVEKKAEEMAERKMNSVTYMYYINIKRNIKISLSTGFQTFRE